MHNDVKDAFLTLFDENKKEEAIELFYYLEKRYNHPSRYYHTMQHIQDCLIALQDVSDQINDLHAVTMAIFFHDIVYDTKSSTNEEDSAETMKQMLSTFNFDDSFIERVYDLIILTKHPSNTDDNDALYLIDIDLLILSSEPKIFIEYCDNIRREYNWVPEDIYNKKRTEFLSSMILDEEIYKTSSYKQNNVLAKENILKELKL